MSAPGPDPLAASVKAALQPSFAELGAAPAGGLEAAVAEGRRLRARRRLRIRLAVAGAVVALVVAAVAGRAWQASTDEEPRRTETDAPGALRPDDEPPVVASDTSTAVIPTSSTSTTSSPSVREPTVGGGEAGPDPGGAPGPSPATTSPPPVPSTTTTTAPPTPIVELLVSTSDDRSSPSPLDGTTVTGTVYVFYDHVAFPLTGPSVSFWIDDPSRSGPAHRVELFVPYDLEATAPGGEAYGFDASSLSPGPHSLTASAGPAHVVTVWFTVA